MHVFTQAIPPLTQLAGATEYTDCIAEEGDECHVAGTVEYTDCISAER